MFFRSFKLLSLSYCYCHTCTWKDYSYRILLRTVTVYALSICTEIQTVWWNTFEGMYDMKRMLICYCYYLLFLSYFNHIYFSSIVKQVLETYINHSWVCFPKLKLVLVLYEESCYDLCGVRTHNLEVAKRMLYKYAVITI